MTIKPYWPRMQTILEADVAYRGRSITQDRTAAMLNDLAPTISYSRGKLKADQVSNPSRAEAVAGRGLVLFPTMFGPGAVIPFEIGHRPELGYPARGQGGLRALRAHPSASDLGRLIGRERLRIISLLRIPAAIDERSGRRAGRHAVGGQPAPADTAANRSGRLLPGRQAGLLPAVRPRGIAHRRLSQKRRARSRARSKHPHWRSESVRGDVN